MDENTKIDPQLMLDWLHSGEPLLPPLVIRHASFESDRAIDALLEVAFNGAADIRLADPIRMLDQLGKNWRLNPSGRNRFYRSSKGTLKLSGLANSTTLAWALTGESSATRYCTIAQGGPTKVAVSDLKLAESLLSLTPESVPSFADIVLIETQDHAAFFANEQDEDGVRYANRIQTWIELKVGDARQRETAKDLYQSIVKASKA